MSTQLKQAIQIAQSLTVFEQLELLKTLSSMIQQTHSKTSKTPLPYVDDAEQAELEAEFGLPSDYTNDDRKEKA